MSRKVLIMRGLPGAGKSTFVSTLESTRTQLRIFSTDHYYMIDGKYEWSAEKKPLAHLDCFGRYLSALETEASSAVTTLVIDNLNTRQYEISPYAMAAQVHGWKLEFHTFLVSPEVSAQRNLHGVPLEKCRQLAAEMEDLQPFWPGEHFIHPAGQPVLKEDR